MVAPPLFTILIFAWVISMTHRYVLDPVTMGVREVLVSSLADIRERDELEMVSVDEETGRIGIQMYDRVNNGTYIPSYVFDDVSESPGEPPPETALAYYRRYVNLTYLRPYVAIPFFLALFILVLYLLGKSIAAGMGRVFWNMFERGIHRLPLVRNVYSSVKQVSDFLFSEREIEYTRVVAVEYPRKDIWSLGLVTGESMLDIRSAANEPVLSVLMPTSPMPVTGFTVTVRRSETIDLNITIEQAFQFIVSCGVVVPPQQMQEALEARATKVSEEKAQGAKESLPQPATPSE